MEFLTSVGGIISVCLVVMALIAVLAFANPGKRHTKPEKSFDSKEEYKLVKAGRYAEAAALAVKYGRFDVALDYYLRAQQPENAATVAAKLNDHRQAAELYERAGKTDLAAKHYQKAGLAGDAKRLLAQVSPRKNNPEKNATAASFDLTFDGASAEPASGTSRSAGLVKAFHALLQQDIKTEAQRIECQRAAREAAEVLLAEGEIRTAAEIYRDADMTDEAIHLFVNVLGAPGEAAPLVAAAGNHERAAELYELAGQKERAANAWIGIAEKAQNPTVYLERIVNLSAELALTYLKREVGIRPLNRENLEFHYRLGAVHELLGQSEEAKSVYGTVAREFGEYKDVAKRLHGLKQSAPASAQQAPDTSEPSTPMQISAHELELLASQVAKAAAEQLRKQHDVMQLLSGATKIRVSHSVARASSIPVGLELAPIKVVLLADDAVSAAKQGPNIDTLMRFIGGQECDLQNIEVYFRLGLAYLASGDWEKAAQAFDQVEEVSPGYRDAYKRAGELRQWRKAMGERTQLRTANAVKTGGTEETRYELRGELGRGGMAVVYRAFDTKLGREVALKFMAPEFSNDPVMHQLFEREARAVAQLNHPNIVTIFDYGLLEDRAFICMEFVDGQPVESFLGTAELSIVESVRIVRQALEGLAYAHDQHIVHRDIKPANLMRTRTGLIKIMDFGLAKAVKNEQKSSQIAGTPSYMPPEQLMGRSVDARADIFAMGVTLYELLSGQLPYEGMLRSSPAKPLDELIPALPRALVDAVMCAISLDPEHRFGNARAFANPLGQLLDAFAKYAPSQPREDHRPRAVSLPVEEPALELELV